MSESAVDKHLIEASVVTEGAPQNHVKFYRLPDSTKPVIEECLPSGHWSPVAWVRADLLEKYALRIEQLEAALRRMLGPHTEPTAAPLPGGHIWARDCDPCNWKEIAKAALADSVVALDGKGDVD